MRCGSLAIALALVLGACTDLGGLAGGGSSPPPNASSDSGATSGDGGSGNGPVDAGAETGSASDAGPAPSCRALLDGDPSLASQDAVYVLATDAGSVRVYCDMTTAGGGWTLVGRSVAAGSTAAFGWKSNLGSVDDDTQPYSLAVEAAGIAFTQLLVAAHAGTKKPFGNAFTMTVQAGLVAGCGNAPCATTSITTVLGTCNPNGGPSMLTHAGFTDFADVFWLRETANGSSHYGLKANGWRLFYGATGCDGAGNLDTQQGVVFVR